MSAPADKLAGRERVIFAERDRKLDAARERDELLVRRVKPPCDLTQQAIAWVVTWRYDE